MTDSQENGETQRGLLTIGAVKNVVKLEDRRQEAGEGRQKKERPPRGSLSVWSNWQQEAYLNLFLNLTPPEKTLLTQMQ